VYSILKHCKGIQISNRYLDSAVTADMTCGEKNFALKVEHLMDVVRKPGMRQLVVEALCTISDFIVSRERYFNIVINISGILETAMDSWVPSFYSNEKAGGLFAYLDDAEITTEKDLYMMLDSAAMGSSPPVTPNILSEENIKEKLRRRIFSTPPIESCLTIVHAFVSYYGL